MASKVSKSATSSHQNGRDLEQSSLSTGCEKKTNKQIKTNQIRVYIQGVIIIVEGIISVQLAIHFFVQHEDKMNWCAQNYHYYGLDHSFHKYLEVTSGFHL